MLLILLNSIIFSIPQQCYKDVHCAARMSATWHVCEPNVSNTLPKYYRLEQKNTTFSENGNNGRHLKRRALKELMYRYYFLSAQENLRQEYQNNMQIGLKFVVTIYIVIDHYQLVFYAVHFCFTFQKPLQCRFYKRNVQVRLL